MSRKRPIRVRSVAAATAAVAVAAGAEDYNESDDEYPDDAVIIEKSA